MNNPIIDEAFDMGYQIGKKEAETEHKAYMAFVIAKVNKVIKNVFYEMIETGTYDVSTIIDANANIRKKLDEEM